MTATRNQKANRRLSQQHEWRERWFTGVHIGERADSPCGNAWRGGPLRKSGPIMLSQKAGDTGRICGSNATACPTHVRPAPGSSGRWGFNFDVVRR